MTPQAKIAALRAALEDERNWLESQRKLISKGCGSSWDMMQCDDRINLINAALTGGAEQAPDDSARIKHLTHERDLALLANKHITEVGCELVAKLHRICNQADEYENSNIASDIIRAALGSTPASIAAEPAPRHWQDCMAEHYQKGESVQLLHAAHFMQQEIYEWRDRGKAKGGK